MRLRESDDDFSLRPIEPEDLCQYCEALDTEPHKDDCPLFLPRCACGLAARRYLNAKPLCKHCYRREVQDAA